MKVFFLLKTLDLAKGTNVWSWYNFFRKTLLWDVKKVDQYRTDRLRALLVHAKATVPYYADLLKDIDAQTIKSVSDLAQLPILDRDAIQNNQTGLISGKFQTSKLHKGSSSGTTGIPIQYFMDANGMSAGAAAGYLLWSMSGWNFGQRNVHIWGNQSSVERWNTLGSKLKSRLTSQKNIASTLLNDPEQIEEIAKSILKFKPISIEGYTSSIYTLAKYFKTHDLKADSVKQVFTTAENLEDYQMELIEQVFAPIGDLYGSGEVLGIASRPAGDNRYYILDTHVIVETVESGVNGLKNILVTDLDNYAMPMIRYKVGDMVDELHKPDSAAVYPFTWFKKIHGRTSDIITLPNGNKFHPVNIFGGTLFRTFNGITRHKTIWDGKKLEFVFEAKGFHENESLHAALKQLLVPYQCDFTVTFTDRIEPSPSGKYKYMEIVKPKISEKDEGSVCQ